MGFRAINAKDMDKLAEQYPRLKDKVTDIKRSALIFPFKASPYLVDELIDWDMAGDIGLDPFYKLVFPTMDMLTQEHQDLLNAARVNFLAPALHDGPRRRFSHRAAARRQGNRRKAHRHHEPPVALPRAVDEEGPGRNS